MSSIGELITGNVSASLMRSQQFGGLILRPCTKSKLHYCKIQITPCGVFYNRVDTDELLPAAKNQNECVFLGMGL